MGEVAVGRVKVGVLVKLKSSARNWSRTFSLSVVFLKIEKSRLKDLGPRATRLAELP